MKKLKFINILMLTIMLSNQFSNIFFVASEISTISETASNEVNETQSEEVSTTESETEEVESSILETEEISVDSAITDEVQIAKPQMAKVKSSSTQVTMADLNLDETNASLDKKSVYDDVSFDGCTTGSTNQDSYYCEAIEGWRTTDDKNEIQIVSDSPSGNTAIELNAQSVASFFKDYEFTAGQRIYYAYEHRGRVNVAGNPEQRANIYFGPSYEKNPYSTNMNADLFPYSGVGQTDYENSYKLQDSYSRVKHGDTNNISGMYNVPEEFVNGRLTIASVYPTGDCSSKAVCNVVDDIRIFTDAIFDNLVTLEQTDASNQVKVAGLFEHVSGDYAAGVKLTFTDKDGNLAFDQYEDLVVKIDGNVVTPSSVTVSEDKKSIEIIIDALDLSSSVYVTNNLEVNFNVNATDYEKASVSSRADYYSAYIEHEEADEIISYYGIDNAEIDLDAPPVLTSKTDLSFNETRDTLTDETAIKACGVEASDDIDADIASKIVVTLPNGFDSTIPTTEFEDVIFTVTDSKKHEVTTVCNVKIIDVPVELSSVETRFVLDAGSTMLTDAELISAFGVSATELADGDLDADIQVDSSAVKADTAGVYMVKFTVTDEEGNVDELSLPVVIDDGSFVISGDYALSAVDFKIAYKDYADTDKFLRDQAHVKVYSLIDGSEITNTSTYSVDKGTWTQEDGTTHNITISVLDTDSSVLVSKTVKGSIDSRPEIVFSTLILEIAEGTATTDSFKTDMTASDEGTDVTANVTVNTDLTKLAVGIHTVTYSVTDDMGNTTTADRVVVINDGSLQVGATTILQSSDYTIRVGQVDTSDNAIITDGSVKLFSGTTGEEMDTDGAFNFDKGGYNASVGAYTIKATPKADLTNSTTFVATVETGDVPVITAPKLTELALDEGYNLLRDVSATDTEDGDFETSDIVVTPNTIDTSKAGVYPVTYTVKDTDGNEVSVIHVYVVNDGSFSVGEKFILQANDYSLRVSEVDNSAAGIIKRSEAKVFDIQTGLPVEEPLTVDPGTYTNEVKVYTDVVVSVTSDPTAQVKPEIEVIGGTLPTIVVPNLVEVPVDGSFDIMAGVSANDAEDGKFANDKFTVTPSSIDTSKAGVYPITYSVTDVDGNEVSDTQVVIINDGTFTVGGEHIIKASNFVLRNSEVDLADKDAQVVDLSKVEIFNIFTGMPMTDVQINVTYGTPEYTDVKGEYAITVAVDGDAEANRKITAKVTNGTEPTLTVPEFEEVQIADVAAYDDMAGVEYNDAEDGTDVKFEISSGLVNQPGINNITYSVTDKDGNVVTATKVVLVNDGSYKVGANYIFQATDFELFIGEVNDATPAAKDAQVMTESGFKLFAKLTGEEVTDIQPTIGYGTPEYQAVEGSYDIAFTVEADSIEIIATVLAGDAPEMTVPELTEVQLNEEFDALAGVTVSDTEDTTISTSDVVVTPNAIDTANAGVYTINYSLTDRDGNNVTATQIVVVNDGTLTIGENFIIKASDYTVTVGKVDTSDAAITAKSNTQVFDIKTGALVDEAVTVDAGTYTATEGIYDVNVAVASDLLANRDIKVTVITGTLPELTAPSITEVAVGEEFDVMSGVEVFDAEDLNLSTADVVVNENGLDLQTAGVYPVTYTVVDSDANEIVATQVVVVNDGTLSIGENFIISAKSFELRVSEVNTDDLAVISDAEVTVFDKKTGLMTTEELVVNQGGYNAVAGAYDVNFTVLNDETTTIDVIATVTEGNMPELTLENDFLNVAIEDLANLDLSEGVTAVDTEDGELTPSVIITSPIDSNSEAGIYVVTYEVADEDGNVVMLSKVVLLNDGTFSIDNDNDFIMKADDIFLGYTHFTNDDEKLKELANVQLFDIRNPANILEITDLSNVSVAHDNWKEVEGIEGTVEFQHHPTTRLSLKQGVTREVNARLDHLPVYDFATDVIAIPTEVKTVEDYEKLLNDLTVVDTEDGDITENVVVSAPKFEQIKSGFVYQVTYTISDTHNNTVVVKRAMYLNDGGIVRIGDYLVKANDFTMESSEFDASAENIAKLSNLEIYDLEGNKLSLEEATKLIVDSSKLENKNGKYEVRFLSEGSEGAYTITVTVVGADEPETKTNTIVETGDSTTLLIVLSSMILVIAMVLKRRIQA